MAAELITPTDHLTGMPLPLVTPENMPTDRNSLATNWHHHFHPAAAPELQTLGGKALRSARQQLVPVELHNLRPGSDVYHNVFEGPELPAADNTEKQFFICVLAAAGYVPEHGIDMRSDNPQKPVRLTPQQVERFKTRADPHEATKQEVERYANKWEVDAKQAWREVTMRHKRQAQFSYNEYKYGYEPMRNFFRQFVLDQDVDVSESVIKRFLKTTDPDKKRALGDLILSRTADQATSEFRSQYQSLHASGYLHPHMPKAPDRLVFRKLGNYNQRPLLLPELHQKLEVAVS